MTDSRLSSNKNMSFFLTFKYHIIVFIHVLYVSLLLKFKCITKLKYEYTPIDVEDWSIHTDRFDENIIK